MATHKKQKQEQDKIRPARAAKGGPLEPALLSVQEAMAVLKAGRRIEYRFTRAAPARQNKKLKQTNLETTVKVQQEEEFWLGGLVERPCRKAKLSKKQEPAWWQVEFDDASTLVVNCTSAEYGALAPSMSGLSVSEPDQVLLISLSQAKRGVSVFRRADARSNQEVTRTELECKPIAGIDLI